MGGHTYFMVNQTNNPKTIACKNREALIFTVRSFRS
jgi:hypothetical protein